MEPKETTVITTTSQDTRLATFQTVDKEKAWQNIMEACLLQGYDQVKKLLNAMYMDTLHSIEDDPNETEILIARQQLELIQRLARTNIWEMRAQIEGK